METPKQAEQTRMELISRSPEETKAIAEDFATDKLNPGDVVLLEGELGAGKTVFVKGLAKACGVKSMVHSPTFAIMHRYRGDPDLIHIDLYREQIGLDDLDLDGEDNAIIVVEWPKDLLQGRWPEAYSVHIDHVDETTRKITIP